jgi:hypothetical protein
MNPDLDTLATRGLLRSKVLAVLVLHDLTTPTPAPGELPISVLEVSVS